MFKIFSNRRLLSLTIILIVSNIIVTGFSLYVVYNKTINARQTNLIDIVERQKSMVTALYEQGKTKPEIIQLIKKMSEKHHGIGKTGEFAIAHRVGDSILFLLASNENVSFHINNVEKHGMPMIMAVNGRDGYMFAKDYNGVNVLAAYTYVPALKWGIVAKISTAEINGPYYEAIGIALVIAIILISLCVLLFVKISNPIIKTIVDSEIHYRSLFENNHVCMLVIDPETLEIVNANPAACDFYGYGHKVLTSMHIYDINVLPPDEIKQAFINVLAGNKNQFVFKHKLSNGVVRDVESSMGNICIHDKKLIYSIIYDITARIQNEIDLRNKEVLFHNLADSGLALIWTSGTDKLCNYFNKPWLAFTGRTLEQELGNGWAEGVHPDDFDQCLKTYLIAFDKQETFDMEYRIRHVSGEYRWIRDMGTPNYNVNGDFLGYIGHCFDISKIKEVEAEIKNKNEQLEIANADKDRLMSIFAHDLKNPFNSLLGFLELLLKNIHKYDIYKIEKQINHINSSAQCFYDLLEDLLMWSRSQSGKISFEPKKLNLNNICLKVIDNLKLNAQAKNIIVNCNVADDVLVFADINMLKTVLRNLVSNAIKFTNNNGNVEINVKQVDAEVVISISDNGVGISPLQLTKIFDVTQIASTTGTANESGTGFGLSLCKSFVEKHGGRIWAESSCENGSVFYFTIPVVIKPE